MSYIAKNGRLYTSGASEALTLLDDKFSVNKSYSKGDSCIYNDYLWKFTSDKPAGEWDSSVVEQCRIMDFVDDANVRLTQVQSQIVPTASIESGETASKAYSVGDLLVKDGILYKVTKAIAKDDTLTVGTNIELDTVGSELSEIKSNLHSGLTVDILADANSFNLTDLNLTQYKLLVATHYETAGGSTGTTTVPMSLAIERKTVSFEWNGGVRAVISIPNSTSMRMASIHNNKANHVVVMGIK